MLRRAASTRQEQEDIFEKVTEEEIDYQFESAQISLRTALIESFTFLAFNRCSCLPVLCAA